MSVRNIELNDILDLVYCAEDYGHWNSVCMFSLYEWAKPVSDEDIQNYALSLLEGYEDEDREASIEVLTEWRNKHVEAEKIRISNHE